MFTLVFFKATLERALKTAAQTALTVTLVGDKMLNAFDTDWSDVGGLALGGAVASVLFSVASYAKTGGPSLTEAEVLEPAPQHRAEG